MQRIDKARKYITKEMRGIEVAPWHSPITPKAEGYDCKTLDIFDRETLLKKYQNGTPIPEHQLEKIEEVDFVGNANDIGQIVKDHGTYDYIVSSHNFEHLPNPIKFLQGCSLLLKDDGIVSFMIPDRRGMFDYYRPLSTSGDLIDAYEYNRTKPTKKQQFDHLAYGSTWSGNLVFMQVVQPEFITPNPHFGGAHRAVYDVSNDGFNPDYADVHCWVFTMMSFELLMFELQYLGLIDFEIFDIESDGGAEFFVHMRKTTKRLTEEEFNEKRHKLLIAVMR